MNVYDFVDKLLDKLSNVPTTIDKISIGNNKETFDNVKDLLKDCEPFENLDLSGNKKSKDLSTKHRLKGNELYEQKKYFSALCAYNQSLCYAENGSEDLGLAFANRSAVYFEINEFDLCKENIKLANENGYPSSKFEKLAKREKNCFKGIKTNVRKQNLLQITQRPNMKYPFIADCLKLKDDEEFGRHIVTDKSLNTGEIVAIDRPFCSILIAKCRVTRCTNCLCQCKMNLFPCRNCASGKKIYKLRRGYCITNKQPSYR